VAHRLVNCFH